MRRVSIVVLAALLLAAAAVYALYSRDSAAARARIAGHSQTITTSLGTMEYATAGEGDPILVIHGAAGGFDQALEMTGALAGRGYQLIAPSRFGYLGSSMPGGLTTAAQADAYVQLLDHLGIEKAAVVAISAGDWSALQFAIRHPERCRALVLLVPADSLPPGTAIHGGALTRAIFNSDFVAWTVLKVMPVAPGSMVRSVLGTDGDVIKRATPDEQARARRILEHLLPVGPRGRGTQFDIDTAAARTVDSAASVGCPVLAISADDDPFGTAARARRIAAETHGRALVFATGGHALIGHFGDALDEIVSFLAKVP